MIFLDERHNSQCGARFRIFGKHGMITDGEYHPREDLLARIATLATTLWGIPVLLAAAWGALFICNVMSPRLSGMAYVFTVILTFFASLIFITQCAYVSIKGVCRRGEVPSAAVKPLKFRLILSLAIALGAGGMPSVALSLGQHITAVGLLFPCGLLLSCGWLAMTALSIGQYGKRGLWLLVGTPVALFWPFWIVALSWGCSSGRGCL